MITIVDVVIVGGGVAGLTAGVFTARANLSTQVINAGSSILNRNAHLENFPGFPVGISPRLFLDLLGQQLDETGGEHVQGKVTNLTREGGQFLVEFEGSQVSADRVICASWSDVSYLKGTGVEFVEEGSKTFIKTDRWGRTSVPSLYAAGRVAGEYHQAVVASGSGARTALTLLEESDNDYYHDWVTPDGYFTDRDREVPPGCDEIPKQDWEERSRESREVLVRMLKRHDSDDPEQHPAQQADRGEES